MNGSPVSFSMPSVHNVARLEAGTEWYPSMLNHAFGLLRLKCFGSDHRSEDLLIFTNDESEWKRWQSFVGAINKPLEPGDGPMGDAELVQEQSAAAGQPEGLGGG
jgi:hypothetical protein